MHILLHREGVRANHKRVYRLYREAGLMVGRRKRRHGVAVEREPLERPERPNAVWSMDFVSDALANGRRIKVLTIVDISARNASTWSPTMGSRGTTWSEWLNEHWFMSLPHVRSELAAWRKDYNEARPHSSLDYQTPAEFAAGFRMGEQLEQTQEQEFLTDFT